MKKQKKMKKPVEINERPGWNSCSNDMDKYKLTRTEQLQKKASLTSKNYLKAREEW